MILTRQMTRDEALQKLAERPYDEDTVRQEFEYVAKKLGISEEVLQSYMDGPNRSYKDFKSQVSIYLAGAKVMRMLGMELGGKR